MSLVFEVVDRYPPINARPPGGVGRRMVADAPEAYTNQAKRQKPPYFMQVSVLAVLHEGRLTFRSRAPWPGTIVQVP